MVFRNLIFNAKVVEQRLGTGVLSHHNPQASVNGDEEEHRQNACSYRRCCNSSVRIREDFFNTHRISQHLSGPEPFRSLNQLSVSTDL